MRWPLYGRWHVARGPPFMVLWLNFRYETKAVIHSNCSEWQFKAQIVNSIFMLQALAAPKSLQGKRLALLRHAKKRSSIPAIESRFASLGGEPIVAAHHLFKSSISKTVRTGRLRSFIHLTHMRDQSNDRGITVGVPYPG